MNNILYVETGTKDVYRNFATEYLIATESDIFSRNDCDVAFLFWRTTPTLMVGKYQNVHEEINLAYAKEHNINIVRRLSGGGTIYTDEGGWQFTFITKQDTQEIDFSKYLSPVLSALKKIGIDASFNGRNDILVDGKKISGNAQYKLADKTVHHGSLLYSSNIKQMVESTVIDDYKIISKGIKSVKERVTNICEHLKTPVSPETFKNLIVEAIAGKNVYTLTEAELERISVIADEKFNNWDVIYGAEPKFTFSRTARFAGGKLTFNADVKKGVIASCAITGDFFSTTDNETLNRVLSGCRFGKEDVLCALNSAGLENAFYNISTEEIASLIAD